jgi:hypothetical protein
MEFVEFPKMPRLSRDCTITEKIDGTNAQVSIRDSRLLVSGDEAYDIKYDNQVLIDGVTHFIRAGSRTRWIGTQDDNFGFALWVANHAAELADLGHGSHFGEWYGRGIQRGYGLDHRRFALFNTHRWQDVRPACCDVVPVVYQGPFTTDWVRMSLAELEQHGSKAAPGFMNPEGIVIWHHAANIGFKKTIKNDEVPKGKVE